MKDLEKIVEKRAEKKFQLEFEPERSRMEEAYMTAYKELAPLLIQLGRAEAYNDVGIYAAGEAHDLAKGVFQDTAGAKHYAQVSGVCINLKERAEAEAARLLKQMESDNG